MSQKFYFSFLDRLARSDNKALMPKIREAATIEITSGTDLIPAPVIKESPITREAPAIAPTIIAPRGDEVSLTTTSPSIPPKANPIGVTTKAVIGPIFEEGANQTGKNKPAMNERNAAESAPIPAPRACLNKIVRSGLLNLHETAVQIASRPPTDDH
jgi:hypothetical protein